MSPCSGEQRPLLNCFGKRGKLTQTISRIIILMQMLQSKCLRYCILSLACKLQVQTTIKSACGFAKA